MNDITPKEVIEILSHYTDLGYGIIIEGDDISKIKQALSLACKTLANGTPYNPTGVLTEADKKICKIYLEDLDKMHTCNEYKLLMSLIDNAPAVSIDWGIDGGDRTIYARPQGECRTCIHRDPEDKKCDCGALERHGCPFPVSDDYFCKFYEKGGDNE